MTVKIDTYTRVLLSVIAVLLTVLSVGLWCETPDTVSQAQAQIPDSGMQLQQVIEKLENLNDSLDEIKALAVSGAIKVQIIEAKDVKKMKKAPAKKSEK